MIYNGKNTKILQRYKDYLSGKESRRLKKTKIVKYTNMIMYFMWAMIIIQTFLSMVISVSSNTHRQTTKSLEDILDESSINKICNLLISYSWSVPFIGFIILDIATFAYGYIIEKEFMKHDYPGKIEKIERKEKKKYSSSTGESKKDFSSSGKVNIRKRRQHEISIVPQVELKKISDPKDFGGSMKAIMKNNLGENESEKKVKITSIQKSE